jgi:membrane protein DedA with SNARE-associated domain
MSAGALVAAGKLGALTAIGLVITASLLADWVWYEAGRRKGDKVLHFIHRFTRDPDFHDRRAKRIFAQHGLPLLLVAKFIPGVDAVAPPLAGTSRTSRVRFLAFDAAGAGLYACVYGGLGYFFSNDLVRAATYVSRAGTFLVGLVLLGICIYLTYYNLAHRHRLVHKSRLARIALTVPMEHGDSVAMPCGITGGQENSEICDSEEKRLAVSCEVP